MRVNVLAVGTGATRACAGFDAAGGCAMPVRIVQPPETARDQPRFAGLTAGAA